MLLVHIWTIAFHNVGLKQLFCFLLALIPTPLAKKVNKILCFCILTYSVKGYLVEVYFFLTQSRGVTNTNKTEKI